MSLPAPADLFSVLFLQTYNTRLVVLSTTLLGIAAGLVGTFLLLRRRSLLGDALSHACLPGIALAFMIMVLAGGTGKALPGLLAGALATGLAGVALVPAIRRTTPLSDEAAMGIVLSVFFGLGIALLGLVQHLPGASAAGLETFIYGKTASIILQDTLLIGGVTLLALLLCGLLFKEFTLLCFDDLYATVQGLPVRSLDFLLLFLVALVTVAGLQAVGLILIIAFLITPPAAARFWTHDLRRLLVIAAVLGGLSGWLGASLSALLPRLPAGALIVLVAAAAFLFSLLFGPAGGVLARLRAHARLQRKTGRQHLLRAAYEILEAHRPEGQETVANQPIAFSELLAHRAWTPGHLHQLLRRARREDHLEQWDGTTVALSEAGFGEAARTTRNHRLWEIYLIRHADVAPNHVDRGADAVEHVLGADLVRDLEAEWNRRHAGDLLAMPPSPHTLTPAPRSP